MYHRIADTGVDPWQLAVSPENFEHQLQFLKQYGRVISLEELEKGLQEGKIKNKSIVITFDDGYLDNFEVARPLLEKNKVPATFFITTKNIGTQELFWWDRLQILLFADNLPEKLDLVLFGQRQMFDLGDEAILTPALKLVYKNFSAYKKSTTKRGQLYYWLWENLQAQNDLERETTLQILKEWAGFNKTDIKDFVCMSENQIYDLVRNDLFTIGGHTTNHPVLINLDKNSQKKEMAENKIYLEKIINKPIKYFAYPSGKFNQLTKEAADEVGFQLAVTTNHTLINNKSSQLQLGRFQVDDINKQTFERNLKNWFK